MASVIGQSGSLSLRGSKAGAVQSDEIKQDHPVERTMKSVRCLDLVEYTKSAMIDNAGCHLRFLFFVTAVIHFASRSAQETAISFLKVV